MKTTLTLTTLAPRNPCVAPARFRRAGLHGSGAGSRRQQARRALRRELSALPTEPRPSP